MKQITEFYRAHRMVILWTAGYIALMWAILFFLFDFNLFSGAQWNRLIHAQLRGFPGFVFGILMLSALPLYAATTTLVVRTGKPPVTISRPAWLPKFPKKSAKTAADKKSDAAPTATAAPADKPLPAELPNELRGAFMRARTYAATLQAAPKTDTAPSTTTAPTSNGPTTGAPTETAAPSPAASDNPAQIPINDAVPAPAPESHNTDDQLQPDGLPLPADFEFGDAPADDVIASPVFTEINFDTPAPKQDNAPTTTHPVAAHLEALGRDVRVQDDIVITNAMAIATHSDSDFWIADGDEWFASGKQKPSPVTAVLRAAAELSVEPVLYLGAQNIMDLDAMRTNWRAAGVRIVTDLTEL